MSGDHPIERRTFLVQALVLWQAASKLAAEHVHAAPPAPQTPYQFVFFNDSQRAALRVLMNRIVPADQRSGGAVGAKADEYIDFILSHADQKLQQSWRVGLKSFGAAVAGGSNDQVDHFLSRQAANEFAPVSDDEIFFVLLKTAVAEGFYTSEEGINKELGYQGMGFVMDWQGCTHKEHQAPSGWRSLLRQRGGGVV